ncbi:MAG: serine/threonine protein kinase [Anaerovoracaceae bacterium]
MNFQDELILSQYKECAIIDKARKVTLVQDIESNNFYIKKVCTEYSKEVFTILKENNFQGIPKVYHIIENEKQLTIIEEYIPGNSIKQLIDRSNSKNTEQVFSEAFATQIVTSLCDILEPLHNNAPPIIHRDININNVIIDSSNNVFLVDFDAAKQVDYQKNKDTILIGTPRYAAPEQYGYGQSDARTDIYALGILLNLLLTGKTPEEMLADENMNNKPSSAKLRKLIETATQLNPASRYQTVLELKKAFSGDWLTRAFISGENSKLPPGLRSKNVFALICFGLIYFTFIFFIIFSFVTEPFPNSINIAIGLSLLFFTPFIIFGNYLNIQKKLPLAKSSSLPEKLLGLFLWTALFCYIGIIFATLETY